MKYELNKICKSAVDAVDICYSVKTICEIDLVMFYPSLTEQDRGRRWTIPLFFFDAKGIKKLSI